MQSPPILPDPGSPYAQFLAEREEINRHKWITSQREGRDIGFERALNEWANDHRIQWRKEQAEDKKR
tara:strand:+ start:469 stop:669 length:201 start_codon:yes stop_codon:yes gene_type:complete